MPGKKIWILAVNERTGQVMLLSASALWAPKAGDPLLPAPTGMKKRAIAGFRVAKVLEGEAAIFMHRVKSERIPFICFDYREANALIKECVAVAEELLETRPEFRRS